MVKLKSLLCTKCFVWYEQDSKKKKHFKFTFQINYWDFRIDTDHRQWWKVRAGLSLKINPLTITSTKSRTKSLRQKPDETTKQKEKTEGRDKKSWRNPDLCKFILSFKWTDGEDYKPSSLREFSSSVNQFLKEGKYPVSIIDDKTFDQARKCLKTIRKQL